MDPLDGIAAADERLGRPFPLPVLPLPLARWVDVRAVGERGAEVAWNLDDSRPGTPGRLALYAGPHPPSEREWEGPSTTLALGEGMTARRRTAPLVEAEQGLRPVTELSFEAGGLHLRLTAQGQWPDDDVVAIARAAAAAASAH